MLTAEEYEQAMDAQWSQAAAGHRTDLLDSRYEQSEQDRMSEETERERRTP